MNDIDRDIGIELHGGNLSRLAQRYPEAPQPFIDLSTGINPYAYPLPPIRPEWLHRLAEAQEIQAAHAAAADYYQVANRAQVALAPGMQPLMFALASLRLKERGASNVAILSPTYTEHARVWWTVGHAVTPVDSIGAAMGSDVLIVCNPNNPDGRVVTAEQLLAYKGWLIIDESFGDAVPALSFAGSVNQYPNRAVLRSCGKFFGVAGLRVSAAIGPEAWIEWLRVAAGPWPVSTAAAYWLPGMMGDYSWIKTMREKLDKESALWRGVLSDYFTMSGHTSLFTLVESDRVEQWYEHLASCGILVRRFDYNTRWLRFGLPDAAHMGRLQSTLARGPAS